MVQSAFLIRAISKGRFSRGLVHQGNRLGLRIGGHIRSKRTLERERLLYCHHFMIKREVNHLRGNLYRKEVDMMIR